MSVESRRALGSRYELQVLLGSGAMGEVWRTHDRTTGEAVAAKLLRREYTSDPEIVGRFIQERSILMGLSHPNIVQVRDLVVEGDDLAIVMDLVDGEDLRTTLSRRVTLPARDAVMVVAATLDALSAAHEKGCLHRDVKPDNVLLSGAGAVDEGAVKLSDFGISRLAQESTVQATGLLGTPGYMPPELFSEGKFSGASDVYAAGVMLYELLAGRTPFSGSGTAHTIGFRHVTSAPPVLPVPTDLWHVLEAMLAKDPTIRPTPAGAAQMLRQLPLAVLDVPALDKQPNPESWATVATASVPEVIRPTQESVVDVGATNLKVELPKDAPAPVAGQARNLAPGATDQPSDNVTNVAANLPTFDAPALPKVEVSEETALSPRNKLLIAAAAVVGVIVLGGAIMLMGNKSGPGRSGGNGQAIEVTGTPVPYPTGLELNSNASYDPEKAQITYDLEFSSQGQGPALRGDVLQVLPKTTDGCPTVVWSVETKLNVPRTSGITTVCDGYVIPVSAGSGAPQSVTATVNVDLGDEPEAKLQAWVQAQEETTAAALGSSVTSDYYPLQRMSGIEVQVPTSISMNKATVPVQILPQWNGTSDQQNPLFRSGDGIVGSPTQILLSIGGEAGVNLTADQTCNGAAYASGDEIRLQGRPQSGCTILASVGNFEDVQSMPFDIEGPQS